MHLICIFIQFTIAGSVSRKNPLTLIKNQVPGYTTALGTQSSATTVPVNLQCAEADGVCSQIRNFVVPLCANITVPYKVLEQMTKHPLTDAGIEKFQKDYKAVFGE